MAACRRRPVPGWTPHLPRAARGRATARSACTPTLPARPPDRCACLVGGKRRYAVACPVLQSLRQNALQLAYRASNFAPYPFIPRAAVSSGSMNSSAAATRHLVYLLCLTGIQNACRTGPTRLRAILFSLAVNCTSIHMSTLACALSVLLVPHMGPPHLYLLWAVAGLYMAPNCMMVLGGAILFANPRSRWPHGKLRRAVWKKIDGGNFTRRERFVFAAAGVAFVFWFQFSGILVPDYDYRRGRTPKRMVPLSQQGPRYALDPPLQKRRTGGRVRATRRGAR